MNIILVGAPGSGKGTACSALVRDYDFAHISTGDLFRANIKNNTEIGQIAKGYMDRGELVPDEVVVRMLKERMEQDDCKKGVLLDGYPRNLEQLKALDEICNVDLVLYLNASDETVVGRLSTRRVCLNCKAIWNTLRDNLTDNICRTCGSEIIQRDDDKEESIKNRLNVYYKETMPIVDEYRKRGIVAEIDANQEHSVSYKEIRKVIDEKLN